MSESTCGFKSRQPHHLASLEKMPLYARVVELADSLDSGSSVHYGRAGSSPASRTIKITTPAGVVIFMVTGGI